jgi:hypothetical protein
MYISFPIIIIVAWFVFDHFKEKKIEDEKNRERMEASKPSKKIESLEAEVISRMERQQKSDVFKFKNCKKELEFVLQKTKQDYLNLKEKYRDEGTRFELANDWNNYTSRISYLGLGLNLIKEDPNGPLFKNQTVDDVIKNINESHIERIKIEKKFQEMLGNKFIDRWNECTEEFIISNKK